MNDYVYLTDAIHKLMLGDHMFIRGPYGNGFEVELYRGKELVIAAEGTGLAPVKGVIDYFARKPEELKKLTLIKGFKTPQDIRNLKNGY